MKYIELKHKDKKISKVLLTEKVFTIGSNPSSDIVLDSPDILPEQARILKDRDHFLIFNLGSSGDVIVSGREVKSTVLAADDIIGIKDYSIYFADAPEEETVSFEAELKKQLHISLIEKMDLSKIRVDEFSEMELWKKCETIVDDIIEHTDIPKEVDIKNLKKEVLDEALKLGPLEDLLADGSVTEIMVNNKDGIFVERKGKLEKTKLTFSSNEHVINIISRIVAPLGRRIDESVPMVDARLEDGSRVNAIIPPLSIHGPMITIRKFSKKMFTGEDLIGFGSLTKEMMDFMDICVKMRKNIVISGGTGSGKTSFLNVVSSAIPADERVVTIEDSAELRLPHENLGSLEARPANIEGKGAVTIRDLVKNALRMRPDRIVVGECRGGEAIDMLQAMNTGHDGSLTTIHANSTSDSILRLETMVLMSGLALPIIVIRRQIASAINIIAQQARMSDGSRKITCISEITGIEDQEVVLKDIFRFKREGLAEDGKVLGKFVATGYIPSFTEELELRGLHISKDIFNAGRVLK